MPFRGLGQTVYASPYDALENVQGPPAPYVLVPSGTPGISNLQVQGPQNMPANVPASVQVQSTGVSITQFALIGAAFIGVFLLWRRST